MEIELKQSLVVSPDPFLDSCFIKNPVKQSSNQTDSNQTDSNQTKNSNQVKVLETKDNLDDFIKESVKEINNANPISNSLESILDKEKTKEVDFVVDDFATNINDTNDTNDTYDRNEHIDENISLEIEDLDIDNTILNDDPNLLKEVDLKPSSLNNLDTIKLKTPNQVYDDILKKAREKVKEAKRAAVTAYLELKAIKKTYMIDDMDDSDSEFENYSDNETD
jgi:rRNA-processing protein FCF1